MTELARGVFVTLDPSTPRGSPGRGKQFRPLALTLFFLLASPALAVDPNCGKHLRATPETPEVAVCLANVPSEYLKHPWFYELARDPDQAREGEPGRISKQSIRKAMAAIALERTARVPSPVTRGPRGGHADFVDGLGRGFDIKAFSSARSALSCRNLRRSLRSCLTKASKRRPEAPPSPGTPPS